MSERRAIWLLAVVLLSLLIMLAAQVGDPGRGGSRLEGLLARAIAPAGSLVDLSVDGIARFAGRMTLRRTLRRDNQRLRAEARELGREVARLQGVESELGRLADAVGYARSSGAALTVADVVFIDRFSRLQTLLLRVESGRIGADQPVVVEAGLVGRVVLVAGLYAKVQLITDRSATVGAMIERTRRQALIRGRESQGLILDLMPLQEDVRLGDRVVTAGIDGVYPRGIPIGTVTHVAPGDELFQDIRVTPAVDYGVLDQAYVLARRVPPEELRKGDVDGGP